MESDGIKHSSDFYCCVQIIDNGSQQVKTHDGVRQARELIFGWELVGYGQGPKTVYKTYDMRLTEGSPLRQDLESWMGDEFTDKIKRFDLKSILGKYCMLTLSSSSVENGVVNHFVNEITPLSSDSEQSTLAKPLTRYGIFMASEPDMDLFDSLPVEIQEQIKSSPEFVSAQDRQSSEDYD